MPKRGVSKMFRFKAVTPEFEKQLLDYMSEKGMKESDACRELIAKGFLLISRKDEARKRIAEIARTYDLTLKEILEDSDKRM